MSTIAYRGGYNKPPSASPVRPNGLDCYVHGTDRNAGAAQGRKPSTMWLSLRTPEGRNIPTPGTNGPTDRYNGCGWRTVQRWLRSGA